MILYRPSDGDPLTKRIEYRPRTCFVMTQLKKPIPENIVKIRRHLKTLLSAQNINEIDAGSKVTGRDFLMKIWGIIITVPLGIAIIDKDLLSKTLANIYYEIGLLQAYGKETLVIKTEHVKIPSDFIRTEYVEYNEEFESNMNKFFETFFGLPEHFERMADELENDPILSVDYLRRAYLITGDEIYRNKASEIYQSSRMKRRAKNSVEMLLLSF